MKNIKAQIIQVLAPNIKHTSQLQCIKKLCLLLFGFKSSLTTWLSSNITEPVTDSPLGPIPIIS